MKDDENCPLVDAGRGVGRTDGVSTVVRVTQEGEGLGTQPLGLFTDNSR